MPRKLKVYYCSQPRRYHYQLNPKIELRGQWLEQAGFGIGDNISVTIYEEGKIVIEKAKNLCSSCST